VVVKIPLYDYYCEDCDNVTTEFETGSKRRKTLPCEKCGKEIPRFYGNHVVGHKDSPRISRAMGVHPSQIKEAMKAFPGSRYDREGNLLIRNRTEKKLRMKQRGYAEWD